MRVLVCIKRVPAPGVRIKVTDDGLSVDTTSLGFTTSPHEECAVEEAIRLTERFGGSVTVLTLGPPEAVEQLRYAASVGADELVLITTDGSPWDPQRTATAIGLAIDRLERERGGFDLILFGNESADSGGYQVGVRVAHRLQRPMVNGITGIDVIAADNSVGTTIEARREIDDGSEVYQLPAPAVLGVREGINLPRYPTMRGRLASKKAPVASSRAEAEPGGQTVIRLHQPEETITPTNILGTADDEVEAVAVAVVDLIEELGLLS